MILEGMLNIYEEIFTDMLNKSEKKELKNSVKEVLSEVKTMRHNYSQEHRLWRDLQEIHLIKVRPMICVRRAIHKHFVLD